MAAQIHTKIDCARGAHRTGIGSVEANCDCDLEMLKAATDLRVLSICVVTMSVYGCMIQLIVSDKICFFFRYVIIIVDGRSRVLALLPRNAKFICTYILSVC